MAGGGAVGQGLSLEAFMSGGSSGVLCHLQQRARVSEQELRYLWVLVSLSAAESVQEVLLEGHPSWKYLQEVQTLLLTVQRSLLVSWPCVHVCVGGGGF